jgi:hypothetical protein
MLAQLPYKFPLSQL